MKTDKICKKPASFRSLYKHLAFVALAFAIFSPVPSQHAATLALDGSITRLDANTISVDYLYFSTLSAGTVTIDILSWEWNYNTNSRVDVNGDGEFAFIDPYIHLFRDDGSLDASDYISGNDDSNGTYGDGSVYALDSYLSLTLTAGDYVLAISAFPFDTAKAVAGANEDNYYPVTVSEGGTYSPSNHGDYRVTLTGDIGTAALTTSTVPEPSAAVLLAAGAVAMLLRRRNRASLIN